MTKVCIIGISGYGRIHYQLLMDAVAAGNAEVIGATIINQDEELEKCANLKRLGCRIFDDYEVMLRELAGKADLCMIPTGTPLHRPMTIAALEAGMHVLVEKPAAGCLTDVRAMQKAAETDGKIVAVGYQHLYTASTVFTKQHILDGTIGELTSIKCLVMWPRNHEYYRRNSWAGKLSIGNVEVNDSPFNNAVAHELMMMLFQAGDTLNDAASPLSVEAELYRANAIESTDTASMRIETKQGVPILFYSTHACRENHNPEIHIQGTKGHIVMTHRKSVVEYDDGTIIEYLVGNERDAMMSSVLDAVSGGDSFICDIALAAKQTEVVDLIRRRFRIQNISGETKGKQILSTFIPGIEHAMQEAYGKNMLLREAGFDLRNSSESVRVAK